MDNCDWLKMYDAPTGGNELNPNTLYPGQTVYIDISGISSTNYEFIAWKDLNGNLLDETVIKKVPGGRYETVVACGGGYVAYIRTQQSKICMVVVSCDTSKGSVSRSGDYQTCGETAHIEATAGCCYKFDKWSDADPVGNQNPIRDVTVMDGVNTYTAYFIEEDFEITVNVNDDSMGSAVSTKNTVQCGETFILTATPTGTNNFDHWEDNNGNTISNANSLTIQYSCGENQYYTAVFKETDVWKLTYVYNYPGSIEDDVVQLYSDGDSITYLNALSADYDLVGWSGGGEPIYRPLETGIFNFGRNVTLYGIWDEKTKYSIQYYGTPTDPTEEYVDEKKEAYPNDNIDLYIPNSPGYIFNGWILCKHGDTPDPTTTPVTGTISMIEGGIDAHAVWADSEVPAYTLTYKYANGTENSLVLNGIAAGTQVALKSPDDLAITYAYHTFVGWNDGNIIHTVPGTIAFSDGDIILVGVWDTQTVTLRYDITSAGSGTQPADETYYSGQNITTFATVTDVVKDGFSFEGWSNIQNASIPLNLPYQINQNMTVYPVWKPISAYTVTYIATTCPSEAPVDNNTYTSGQTAIVKSYRCSTASGCENYGWSYKGTCYAPGEEITVTENILLTECWNCCDITFKTNNNDAELLIEGTVTPWDTTINLKKDMEFDVNPPKNCCFDGWLDDAKGVFIERCTDKRDITGYSYVLLPEVSSIMIDPSIINHYDTIHFMYEVEHKDLPYTYPLIIQNDETGEIMQAIAECGKGESYELECGEKVTAIISCCRLVEIKKNGEDFERDGESYNSIYDYINKKQCEMPISGYVEVIIRGVSHYYEYLNCDGSKPIL